MNQYFDVTVPGIPDKYFIRGNVPMTKEEVRSITLSKMRIKNSDTVLDIGAGTGSVSIEAALMASNGKVYAIEKNNEAVSLIKQNMERFHAENISIYAGVADELMNNIPMVDKVFIGGSGGKLKEIFDCIDEKLNQKGVIVLNTVTIENLYKSLELLKQKKYKDIDIVQVCISKGKGINNITMLKALNPIFIVSAVKEEGC